MADEERIASCIRGYHIYLTVWKTGFGEVLSCAREPTNGMLLLAMPKRISRVFSSFICQGGEIMCEVTGRRRYSRDPKILYREVWNYFVL